MKGTGLAVIASTALASLALLSACAGFAHYGLEAGRSSEADVRGAMGTPAMEFANPDGTRQLAYPTGPLGTQTHMAFISGDGKLVRLEQVLDEAHFARIVPGQSTREDVRRLIGPPFQTLEFRNLGQVAWDYHFMDAWGYLADLSVMIDGAGRVAGKVVKRYEPRSRD